MLTEGIYNRLGADGLNATTTRGYGTVSTYFRGSFALLLRAGFIFIQIASIPTSNVYVLLFYNFVDLVCTTTAYGIIGYTLSYVGPNPPAINNSWILSSDTDMDQFMFGWSACTISSVLITTCFAGRVHILSFVFIFLIFGGFIHPLIQHWIWYKKGLMHKFVLFSHRVSIKDHSGCLVIHTVGSFIGIMGTIILGRRVLRLKDIQENSISADSPSLCVVGYILIILGLIAMGIPTSEYELNHIPANYLGLILVNNLFAMVGSAAAVICLHYLVYQTHFNYWILLQIVQSAVAGIVLISAGVDVLRPLTAFFISLFGGIIFYFFARIAYYSSLEDYCNILPIHFISGVLGILIPPLLGSGENLGFNVHYAFLHLGWQAICLSIVLIVLFFVYGFILMLLKITKLLRTRQDAIDNKRAIIILRNISSRCFFQRLFTPTVSSRVITPGELKIIESTDHREQNELFSPREYAGMRRNVTVYQAESKLSGPFYYKPTSQADPEVVGHHSKSSPSQQSAEITEEKSITGKSIRTKTQSETSLLSKSTLLFRFQSETQINPLENDQSMQKRISRPWNACNRTRLHAIKRTSNSLNLTKMDFVIEHRDAMGDNANVSINQKIFLNDPETFIIKSPGPFKESFAPISNVEIT